MGVAYAPPVGVAKITLLSWRCGVLDTNAQLNTAGEVRYDRFEYKSCSSAAAYR
jgi:ABC-type uncharacterized transport system YnjBCD ATPase subunit